MSELPSRNPEPTYGDVVCTAADHVGIPREQIDRFLGTLQMVGWHLTPIASSETGRKEPRSWKEQDADMLAAAVDAAIRRGALDPRSEIADCRLDYGRPFSPEEVERHLSKRRHGKNAALRTGDERPEIK